MLHSNVRCAISLLPITMGITQPLTSLCKDMASVPAAFTSVGHNKNGDGTPLASPPTLAQLRTDDDPQPSPTPLAVSPTTRQADGLNFDLLNRSRLALHLCWPNRWWTHWKVEGRVPNQSASHKLGEGTATVLASRPQHTLRDVHQQSFRWMKANWACSHCDTPAINGLGRCAALTHSLPEAHPQHRHSRERQTFLWSTVADNRCPQMVPVS